MTTAIASTDSPKSCFVVMGFGIKTDFATGRQLDLNKSYKILIKPLVESKGLTCIRADEIQYSGSMDLYMYDQLLNADIVIADLSTSNVNAFYELGIRHALRPHTTIVISEDKLSYPFDLNNIKISSYTHLGGAIDYEEVERFRKVLSDTIDSVLTIKEPDSPVYTYLHDLIPPSLQKKTDETIGQIGNEVKKTINNEDELKKNHNQNNSTLAVLTEQGEMALRNRDYISAKAFFGSAVSHLIKNIDSRPTAHDSYLIHRLALATYKAQLPGKIPALIEATELLAPLNPDHTNDPETVTLAGKIEKQLFCAGEGMQHLRKAVSFYERGYYLLQNRCNGINYAFLLNNRVNSSLYNTKEDKMVDMFLANRIRREVLIMCDEDLKAINAKKNKDFTKIIIGENQNLFSPHEYDTENEERFEILANKAEAYFGLGEMEEYKKTIAVAKEVEHPDWMMTEFEEQIAELREIMKKYGVLLNPLWSE